MYAIISILVLGILIFVHELGHFLLAKLNRIGVYEFSIGFGKKLWRRRIGDTYYAIGAIPLGGYVSMAGEDPSVIAAMEKSPDNAPAVEGESGDDEVEDDLARFYRERKDLWFLRRPYFAKLSVVVAGPLFNYLFAILISIVACIAYGVMVPVEAPVIGEVLPGLAADKAGVKTGDRVFSIDGQPVSTWIELADRIAQSGGKQLELKGERLDPADPSKTVPFNISVAGTLDYGEYAAVRGEKNDRYRIGISQGTKLTRVSAGQAIVAGTLHVWGITTMTIRGIVGMIEGAISPKHIAGPIFIFSAAKQTAEKGIEHLLGFIVFLSVSLAILNILPIPVLDGGHILLFTIEAIVGRPLSLKAQQVATQIGLAFLLLLTLFAVGNDIRRLFS